MPEIFEDDTFLAGREARMLVAQDELPSVDQMRDAVSRGLGVSLGKSTGEELDLEVLRPIIHSVKHIHIQSNGDVIGGALFAEANSLVSLVMNAKLVDRADLSEAPNLRAFEGDLTKNIASVSANPHLENVTVHGPIARNAQTFVGPVSDFVHSGAAQQMSLPNFLQPEKLERLTRSRVSRFDGDCIRAFRRLRSLNIQLCPDVLRLNALGSLPDFKTLVLTGCSVADGWERLPRTFPNLFVRSPRPPFPSEGWLKSAEDYGWNVLELRILAGRRELFAVDEPDHDEPLGWAVSESDFLWLSDATEGKLAGGTDAERLLVAWWARLHTGDGEPMPVFDSESEAFFAYFPDKSSATRFAKGARRLARNAKLIRELLQD